MSTPNDKLIEFRLDDIAKDVKEILDALNGEKGLVIRTDRLEQRARRGERTTGLVITAVVGGTAAYVFDLLKRP